MGLVSSKLRNSAKGQDLPTDQPGNCRWATPTQQQRNRGPSWDGLNMAALNFSPEFAGPVERREKRQTIRQTRRAKIGDSIQLYTGQSTKACRKLVEVDPVCTFVGYVAIRPDYLTVSDNRQHPRDIDDFARLDGFKDYAAMVAWLQAHYGQPSFIGYLHRWEWQ